MAFMALPACLDLKAGDAVRDAGNDAQGGPAADGSSPDADAGWPPPNPTWSQVPDCATSIGSGWITDCTANNQGNYSIAAWVPTYREFAVIPVAYAANVTVDLNGNPWVVNLLGQIYRWTGDPSFSAFGGGFVAIAVAAGSGGSEIWAIQGDQTVWNWTGSVWVPIQSPPVTKLAIFSRPSPCGDHVPWAIDENGHVYSYVHSPLCGTGSFEQIVPELATDITTDFILGTDGYVQSWNAATGTFDRYVASPWGANAKIGGWINGFFAAGPGGAIQQICQLAQGPCP
jgi:hypothetical protein